jgi:hypothetical protein
VGGALSPAGYRAYMGGTSCHLVATHCATPIYLTHFCGFNCGLSRACRSCASELLRQLLPPPPPVTRESRTSVPGARRRRVGGWRLVGAPGSRRGARRGARRRVAAWRKNAPGHRLWPSGNFTSQSTSFKYIRIGTAGGGHWWTTRQTQGDKPFDSATRWWI